MIDDGTLRILHIEDDPADAALILRILRDESPACRVVRRETLAGGLQRLAEETPDLVLLDMHVPDGEGLELVEAIRRAAPTVPVVALTGSESALTSAQAVLAGAQDFVGKDAAVCQPGLLYRSIRYAVERQRMLLQLEERAQALARDLTESEARFRRLVETSVDGLLVVDAQETIRYANRSAERLLGAAPGALVGQRWSHGGDRERTAEIRLGARSAGKEEEGWAEVRHSETTWEGAPASLISLRDVTERREVEAALQDSEQQLRQAQKMEAIGRLAGGVAHDFNNLLTAISGYGGLLMEALPESDPSARTHLEEILRAAERAAGLTRQLLAFGRRQVIQPRVIDLREVLEGLTGLLERLIREDVQIRVEVPQEPCRVLADPGQIEQVIMNLAVNSRDAMPEGGRLSFLLDLEQVDEDPGAHLAGLPPGRYVVLSVRDTGAGMDDHVLAHLFDPFFTTKEVGKGTGLGLSTVYGIVRQHEGHVEVESAVGEGTTFTIRLPFAEEEAPASEAQVPRPHQPGTGEGPGSTTILLVEDEPQVRALTRTLLARAGYHVLEAGSGEEALGVYGGRRAPIQLLMTDVVMPAMNGIELFQELQALQPDLKVIYTSGYPHEAVSRHGVFDSGGLLLEKPFTPAELIDRVELVLTDEE